MNDEKAAVINMVSEGTITSSEGLTLFETLCDLEDMKSCESGVEAEDPRYLPPWESENNDLFELLFQNKCARVISSANQEVISALRAGNLEDIPSKIGTLDVIQLSRFKLRPKEKGNGGFAMLGSVNIKFEDNGLRTQNLGMRISCWLNWMSTDLKLPPTWWEPMLMQVFAATRPLRLKWEIGEVMDEEADCIRLTSTIESFDDSVVTKAGRFDGCLKLKTVIRGLENQQFENDRRFDMNDNLRLTGTRFIWLAPNVGIVKFLYEHGNDTKTEVELVDYHVQGGEPLYFPLSLGNKWRYQWQDEVVIHKELLRVILHNEDGSFVLCCAKPMIEIT